MPYKAFGVKTAEFAKDRKRRPRKRTHLSQAEKTVIAEIASEHPSDKQLDALAVSLRRDPITIKSYVASAREKLQANAEHYVDQHRRAMDLALLAGDYGETRKAAEFGMTNISAKNSQGETERIVERAEAESTSPKIQIGISLGGLPAVGIKQA